MTAIITLAGSIGFLLTVTKAGIEERNGNYRTMWAYVASAAAIIALMVVAFSY